jgi:ABC-type multidrug transport system fused ATPase/permease subunit
MFHNWRIIQFTQSQKSTITFELPYNDRVGALLKTLVAGFSRLSRRGRRSIIFYGFSLVALAGIDGIGLVLLSRLVTLSGQNETTDDLDKRLVTLLAGIVILFISRSILSIFVSWKGMKDLSKEEILIGQQNLFRLDSLPWSERKNLSINEYYSAVDRGPYSLVQGLLVTFTTLIAEMLSALVILLVLLTMQPTTAITAIVFFASIAVLQHRILSVSASRAGSLVASKYSSVYELLSNKADLGKILQVMPSHSYYQSLHAERTELAGSRARLNFLAALPRYFMEAMLVLGFVVVAFSTYVFEGSEQILDALIIFAAAGFRLLPIVNRIQGLILHLFGTAPLAIEAIVDEPLTNSVKKLSTINPNPDLGEVLLMATDVGFSHGGENEFSLDSISLSLVKGKHYAIVGPSGAGKTTLVDLILGILEPTKGNMERSSGVTFSYVPQETRIFSGSLFQNIALEWNDENVNSEKARNALRQARFPESVLSSQAFSGKTLSISGGEAQRLGLARALYRDSDVLILDETTSALDSITEHEVMQAVKTIDKSKTVLVIAHRLSTIKDSDEIIFMDSGRILAIAPFEELREIVPKFEELVSLNTLEN